jgi:hypothetical protein
MRLWNRRFVACFVVLVPVVLSGAGCKSNTIDNDTNNTNTNGGGGVNVIGAQGGVVLGPEGASVRIPAGALTKDESISIRVAEPGQYPPLPGKYATLGKVFAFEPHGLKFLSPAILTLPVVADGKGNAGLIGIRAEGGAAAPAANADSWQPITAQVAVDAQISTPSFSYYAIARAAEGPADAGPSCSGRNFDGSAPAGTLTNLSGTVTVTSFPASGGSPTQTPTEFATAVDGYAAVVTGEGNQLSLTFTAFAKACGYVRNGVQKNDSTSFNITVRDLQAAITTKTYDASARGSVTASGSKTPATAEPNGTCALGSGARAPGSDTSTGTVTITALSATKVVGSFANLNLPGSATNVSGSFDLPICTPLPNLSPSLCCLP